MNLEEKRASYPRVSDIIGKQNVDEFRNIPMETYANACTRGTKVHAYCTAWMNHLWVTDVEPEYKPYVESFQEWVYNHVDDCVHSAVRLYDDLRRFTGEFDMIVKLKTGKLALIDIKTSATKGKTWPIQLSAYAHLCKLNGYEFDQVYNIHLKKVKPTVYEEIEGQKVVISPLVVKAVEMEYPDLSKSWEIFTSALECYDFFSRKEAA